MGRDKGEGMGKDKGEGDSKMMVTERAGEG